MQVEVPGLAVADEFDDLDDCAPTALVCFQLFEPILGALDDAGLDAQTPLQMAGRLFEHGRDFHAPVDPVDVAPGGAQDSLQFVAEAHRLDAGLSRRVYRFVQTAARELRFDHGLGSRLGVLDVEIEQAQVQVAGLVGEPQDGPAGRVKDVGDEAKLKGASTGLAVVVDGGVVLAEHPARVGVVAQSGQDRVGHARVSLGVEGDVGAAVHGQKDWLKRVRHDFAVGLPLHAHVIDQLVEDVQGQGQSVVVAGALVPFGVTAAQAEERAHVQEHAQPARDLVASGRIGGGERWLSVDVRRRALVRDGGRSGDGREFGVKE